MKINHRKIPLLSSRPTSQDGLDLHADRFLDELQALILFSSTPQTSIHFEMDGKIQRRTLFGSQPQHSSSVSQDRDRSQSRALPATPAPLELSLTNTSQPLHEAKIHEDGANTIYAIASYTKILINIAYYMLISRGLYKSQGLSWDKSACDLFNDVCRTREETRIRRFARDPTILELLLHRNGFAPMNRFLFAPDETFIVSKDEFLEVAPRITEDYFKGEKQGWSLYSNANHIFAGIILEGLTGRQLHKIMQEVVFDPLRMAHTIMDKQSLDNMEATGTIVAEGHRVSGDMSQTTDLPKRKYLTDTAEVASLGARSCTEDLAKLIREFLKALDQSSSHFREKEALDFFGPKANYYNGGKVTLGGLFCSLGSTLPGEESLNRVLVRMDGFSPYTLGTRPSGSQCHVYHKAGSVDGFTSTVYVSLKHRVFVIVLANSSGPVDITDPIARYVLQEALDLSPRVDILRRVTEEGLRASNKVQYFERVDADLAAWSDSIEAFAGNYKHVKYGQELEITTQGEVFLRGRCKSSSPMRGRVSGQTLRIFPGQDGFGIDRWSVWDNRDFTMVEREGRLLLIGNKGEDYFERIHVPQP